jgi:transposase
VQEVIPVKKRSPYSLVDVKGVKLDGLIRRLSGQECVVGVDVAKKELVACVYGPERQFERPWQVAAPREVRLLVERLVELGRHCRLQVAMESSGTYGDAFRQALTEAGVAVERVSSKAVKDHAEAFDGVPSQHDGKDAAVIAELCREGHSKPWPWWERPEEDQALRYWVRKLDTAQRIKQVFAGKFEALLARHWPEAGRLLAASGASLPKAMAHWGGPRELAGDPQAAAVLARMGGHYLTKEKIAAVIASAGSSIGVRMGRWARREMKDIARAILARRRQIRRCRRQLRGLVQDHPTIQAQAPALGLVTACVLWVCLGDVSNYPSAAAYRKAMGLNLRERSSGQHKGRLSITKRGQRLTRKWLYFSALRWLRDPAVKAWARRKKERDGEGQGNKAVVAVMRRLALAAWYVGKHGEAFEASRLFPGTRRPKAAPTGKEA